MNRFTSSLITIIAIGILSFNAMADDQHQHDKMDMDTKPTAEAKPHSHPVEKGTAPASNSQKQDMAPMDTEAKKKAHQHQKDAK